MRKITILLIILCISLSAQAFVVDGILYHATSKIPPFTVEVTQENNSGIYISGDLIIPSQVTYSDTTYTVTAIGYFAFSYFNNLHSVTMPSTVISIGDGAFCGCSSMKSITIPYSVTRVGAFAFECCVSLTSIEIPNPNTIVEMDAFYDCDNLTNIITPSYDRRFDYSSNKIESITITRDSLTPYYAKELSKSHLTFRNVDLAKIPNTNLPIEMFRNCPNLENLKLPKQLTNISYRLVSDCASLKAINIPATVSNIDMRAFENSYRLKKVTFEAGSQLKTIGNWAFYTCHALDTINIPAGVTIIGDGAFWGCDSLKNISLPSSLSAIGDNAFDGCKSINFIQVDATTPPSVQGNTFNQVNKSISVKVPKGSLELYKTALGWKDFNYLTETSIDIPDYDPVNCFVEDGNVVVTGARSGLRLIISDLHGRQLYNQIIHADNTSVKLSHKGVYLINVGGKTKKILF